SAICEGGGRFEATSYGLIVKGKRISCPPHYAPPNNDYEHGFPLIRSLRASTQRSTSVLFSFVLCLLIVAGSFAIRQSKTILARCQSRPNGSTSEIRSTSRWSLNLHEIGPPTDLVLFWTSPAS